MYPALETFYSVFNERISDLSISNNGNLIQSVSQDGSSAEYRADEFHEISRLAGEQLGGMLREYEIDEIITGTPTSTDQREVRLPIEQLLMTGLSADIAGVNFDEMSHEMRDYLFTHNDAFDTVWALIDNVIRLESKTDIESPNRQKLIAEHGSLINFIKENALIPFVKALKESDLNKGEIVINMLAQAADTMADFRAHLLSLMSGRNANSSAEFIVACRGIMKDVFGDDVKLSH
jgi:hypothetical protein